MGEERPKVGVGVWIVKDGKVLLGKRKSAHGNGTWSPPGGHLEFGESWQECALRELAEEAGVKIKNLRFLAATNDIFEETGKHYVTIYLVADHESGEPQNLEPEKLERWEWVAWENLPEPLFLPVQNLRKLGLNPCKL